MPIHPFVGIVATCTNCGPAYWTELDSVPYFSSIPAAKAGLSGWRWEGDLPLLCPTCAAEEDCARFGHEFSRWHDCRCGGAVHGDADCPRLRWCGRCGVPDYAHQDEQRGAA